MTNDLTPEIELVLKHFITLPDVQVNRQQLEQELKIDSSALSIILNKMVNKGYMRAIDKTEDGIGILLFSLTPAGKAKAKSLT